MIELTSEGMIPNTHNKKYIIDAPSELSQLEADFGNEAYCISEKKTYICNGVGEYVEGSATTGGGGGDASIYTLDLSSKWSQITSGYNRVYIDDIITLEELSRVIGSNIPIVVSTGVGYILLTGSQVAHNCEVGYVFYNSQLSPAARFSGHLNVQYKVEVGLDVIEERPYAQVYDIDMQAFRSIGLTPDQNDPLTFTCQYTNRELVGLFADGYEGITVFFNLPEYPGAQFAAIVTTFAAGEPFEETAIFIGLLADPVHNLFGTISTAGYGSNTTWTLKFYNLNNECQTDIDYQSLVDMRNGGNLVPGRQYRITDYATIINGSYDLSDLGAQGYLHYAQSVENDFFDIIVTADDASHLNENARACRREGSTYAPDAKIESWEIKYCLDNDTNRFAWAHSDGKGVVYYMKDEFGNEAGYDFKNIQFIRYGLAESQHHPVGISDSYELIHDENEGCYGRYGTPFHLFQALQAYASAGTYINPFSINDGGGTLDYYDYDFAVGSSILGAIQYDEVDDTYLSTFDAGWYYTFDFAGEDASVHENAGYYCRQNSIGACCDAALAFVVDKFDTYGLPCNVWMCFFPTANIQDNKLDEDCFYNTFGTNSWRNHLGKLSAMNCIGESCYDLHLGNRCVGNIFERSCFYDVLGDECKYNIFHYSFTDSTLGAECEQNYFCSSTQKNSLGVDCDSNVFYNVCNNNELSSDCDQNVLGYGSTGNKFFYSDEIYLTADPASDGCNYCIFSNCTYIRINSSSIHLTFINVANSRLLSNSQNSTFSDCNYLYLGGAEYSTFRCLEHVAFGEQAEEYDGNVFTSNIANMQYVNFEHDGISNVSTYGAVILVNIPDTIDLNTYIYEIRGATVTDTGKATIVTKVAFGNESGTSTADGGNTWS